MHFSERRARQSECGESVLERFLKIDLVVPDAFFVLSSYFVCMFGELDWCGLDFKEVF